MEEHCRQISPVVGSAGSVWATLALPPLMARVLSRSALLRLTGALQGDRLKRALGCVRCPGPSRWGSGSRVLQEGTRSVGPAFCALPKSEQLRRPCAWECTLPGVQCIYHLPHPSHLVSWVPRERCAMCLLWGADLGLQPSWQMPTVQDLRETWLAIGSLLAAWWRMLSLG